MTAPATATHKQLDWIRPSTAFYGHQVEGIRHLATINSWILADDMGLGKTLQSLAVAAIDVQQGYAKRILVVTLAGALKWNWQEDIEKFTLFKSVILNGTPKKRAAQLTAFADDPSAQILIVNYDQVNAHHADFNRLGFDIVILDEAHAVKGHDSQRTRAIQALDAERFFLLTGSPLLNRPDELWSLLHRCDRASFPKYWAFRARYCAFGGFKGKQVVGPRNKHELEERLHSYMLRRLKKDVLDLPEKQYIKVIIGLSSEQQKLYDQAKDELRIELPDDPDPMELENALTKFLRLKQICGSTLAVGHPEDHSEKLDRAVQIIEEKLANGEPVVVFTQFRGVLEALVKRLAKVGPTGLPFWQLHGDVAAQKRQPIIREWSEAAAAGRAGALCCMLQVAGVGLNMTAASTAVMLDQLFVPKLNEQAEDRLHRIGADKTKPVQIVKMICKGTVEDRVEKILEAKRKLFDELIDTNDLKRAVYAALRDQEW